jgi:hypothetical protein
MNKIEIDGERVKVTPPMRDLKGTDYANELKAQRDALTPQINYEVQEKAKEVESRDAKIAKLTAERDEIDTALLTLKDGGIEPTVPAEVVNP